MSAFDPTPKSLHSRFRRLQLGLGNCCVPGHLLLGLLAVEGVMWLSSRLGWPQWHKGYAVLVALAGVLVAFLGMSLWYLAAVLFHGRFQFSLRWLLVSVAAKLGASFAG